MSLPRSTLQLILYPIYIILLYILHCKNHPLLVQRPFFWPKKKQQNAPLACEVCVFLTERNLKLRKIAGKARAARSRCACGAYLYIQILDIEMSYFKRWLLRNVCGLAGISSKSSWEALSAVFKLRYNSQKALRNDRKGTPNRTVHVFWLKIQIWKFPTQQHAKNFFLNVGGDNFVVCSYNTIFYAPNNSLWY